MSCPYTSITCFQWLRTDLQELWQHAERFGWNIAAIHSHIYRLADTLCSSKETVEDLFGKGADMKRQNKNPFKAGSVERFHFNNSHWIRLPDDAWPKMQIQRDDVIAVQHQPRRTHVNLGSAALNGHVIKTLRVAVLKKNKGFSTKHLAFVCSFASRFDLKNCVSYSYRHSKLRPDQFNLDSDVIHS